VELVHGPLGLQLVQAGYRISSDSGDLSFIFKKLRTSPPRTVVTEMAATRTDVFVQHTTHDTPANQPSVDPGQGPSSSSISRTPTLVHLSPHSSVQEWLATVDDCVPLPSPSVPISQPVSALCLKKTTLM